MPAALELHHGFRHTRTSQFTFTHLNAVAPLNLRTITDDLELVLSMATPSTAAQRIN